MSFNLYGVDDDENLILLAEIETDGEDVNPAIILDMFLDAADEDTTEYDTYAGIDLDQGSVVIMSVPDHEPVQTRRNIEVMTADDDDDEGEPAPAPKRRGRPPGKKNAIKIDEVPVDDDEEDEAPAPKRRGRPPGSKNKPGAKKPGPKAKSNKKSGGIKKNAASEE